MIKVSTIKNNPNNPRTINGDKLEKLKRSIKSFPEMMEKRPMICVTDVDGKIFPLGGNMRLRAIKDLGMKEIPKSWALMADEWTEEQRKEFIIKDNASLGSWDLDDLQENWDLDLISEWGVDLELDEVEELEAEEDNFEVELPEDPKTVLGDLYEIGEHRLLCGDSTDSDAVAKLMNGEKADMVFTDPPYRQKGHIEAAESEAKQQKKSIRKSTTEISPSLVKHAKKLKGLLDFEPKKIIQTLLTLNPLCVYIFCNKSLVKEYLNYFEGYNYTILVWKKPTVSPFYVADYLADIEYLLYFNKAGKIWNNKNEYNNYSRVLEAKQERGDHPTIKPVHIIEPAILNSSNKNSIVLDFFLGSGSTMVAAHQLKRKCYGMELDPKYCDVIINRMLKLDPDLKIKRNGVDITNEWN